MEGHQCEKHKLTYKLQSVMVIRTLSQRRASPTFRHFDIFCTMYRSQLAVVLMNTTFFASTTVLDDELA